MLMEELVCQHFHDWSHFEGADAGLVGSHPLPKRLHTLYTVWPGANAIEMSVEYRAADGSKHHAGDVVLLGAAHAHACGKVWYHVNVDDVAWTCIEVWPVIAACGPRCNKHRIDCSTTMLRSTDLRERAWHRALGDCAIVRLPMHYVCKEALARSTSCA